MSCPKERLLLVRFGPWTSSLSSFLLSLLSSSSFPSSSLRCCLFCQSAAVVIVASPSTSFASEVLCSWRHRHTTHTKPSQASANAGKTQAKNSRRPEFLDHSRRDLVSESLSPRLPPDSHQHRHRPFSSLRPHIDSYPTIPYRTRRPA